MALLLKVLPLLCHVFVVEMDVAHGALDLRVPQALLHVADVPIGADQLRRMSVSQHMCMEGKVVLAAVMPEHCFDCLTVQRATVSNPAALVSCCRLEDNKEVVRHKMNIET